MYNRNIVESVKTPVVWWKSYGDQHLELQRFVIHVLTILTCNSSE